MRLTASAKRELVNLEAASASSAVRSRCEIVRFAAGGHTVRETAAELSVSARTVQKWIDRYRRDGVESLKVNRARGRTAMLREGVIEQLLTEGRKHTNRLTTREAARLIGVSASTVHRVWKRFGVR